MMMTAKARFAAALLVPALFSGAPAQTAAASPAVPEGMVDDPCVGLPVAMSPALLAWRASVYADENRTTAVALPAGDEVAAFRDAQAAAAKRDWADLCRYRADNMRLAGTAAGARRVVFMGDSITQGWGQAHPGFFGPGMINRGISGQTTPQMLLRFQQDVVALHPQLVHIMAGTNDVAGNTGANAPDMFKNNIVAMVQLARVNHIGVILAAIPPAKSFTWRPQLQPVALIRHLNTWLKDYAGRERLTFVDYGEALAEPDGAMKAALTFDGIHPNGAGYSRMEPVAQAALRRAGVR